MQVCVLTCSFSDIESRPRENAYISGHNQVAFHALLRSVRNPPLATTFPIDNRDAVLVWTFECLGGACICVNEALRGLLFFSDGHALAEFVFAMTGT